MAPRSSPSSRRAPTGRGSGSSSPSPCRSQRRSGGWSRCTRTREPGELAITEEVPPDARTVIGTSFLRYLRSQERLTRRLELMSALAHTVRVFNLEIPDGVTAAQTAAAIADHAKTVVHA